MKKTLIASGLLFSLMAGSAAYAAEMVDAGSITVTNASGLVFKSMLLTVDQANMNGSIEFVPSTPVSMPVMQGKPELPAGNTVGMLKNKIAQAVNHSIKTQKMTGYTLIRSSDVVVYGGPFLNTTNSFTNAKVLAARDNGEPYRVKITLSSQTAGQVVQTVIQGNFTIFTPSGMGSMSEEITVLEEL